MIGWLGLVLVALFVLAILAGMLGWVRAVPGKRTLKQEMSFYWVASLPVVVIAVFFLGGFWTWLILIFLLLGTCYFFYCFEGRQALVSSQSLTVFVQGAYKNPEDTLRRVVAGFNSYCKAAD